MLVLASQDYLVPPVNELDNTEFTVNLIRYYQADNPENEQQALLKMVELVPDQNQRKQTWQEQQDRQQQQATLVTRRVKTLTHKRLRR